MPLETNSELKGGTPRLYPEVREFNWVLMKKNSFNPSTVIIIEAQK
jgi:hypothetical protein